MTSTAPLLPDLAEVHAFYRRMLSGSAAPRLRRCETLAEFEAWLTCGTWGLAADVARSGTQIVGLATLTRFGPLEDFAVADSRQPELHPKSHTTIAELTIACDADLVPTRNRDMLQTLVARAVHRAAAARLHCLSAFLVDDESALHACLIDNGFSQAGELTIPAGVSRGVATPQRVRWLWAIVATADADSRAAMATNR